MKGNADALVCVSYHENECPSKHGDVMCHHSIITQRPPTAAGQGGVSDRERGGRKREETSLPVQPLACLLCLLSRTRLVEVKFGGVGVAVGG